LAQCDGRAFHSTKRLKLSDGGAWRGECPTMERTKDAQMQMAIHSQKARAVTGGAVRYIAWLDPGSFNVKRLKVVADDGVIVMCAGGRHDYSIDFAGDDGKACPYPALAAVALKVKGEAG